MDLRWSRDYPSGNALALSVRAIILSLVEKRFQYFAILGRRLEEVNFAAKFRTQLSNMYGPDRNNSPC